MDLNQTLAQLSSEEQRVLGSLIEKSKTTPDYYPMSINGLQSACNQKTSRSPIVQYDEETIIETLNSLKKKSLISTATGGSSRVVKYKHNLGIVYPLVPSELALIGLLLLRGPQTPGELNTNSGRLYEFENIEEVQTTLQDLSKRGFVKVLERRPGQKEARYVHLLGESIEEPIDHQSNLNPSTSEQLNARIEILERELSELKEAFNKLLSELT
jgi:uncharacterized protein YceH (UPF0502 family)